MGETGEHQPPSPVRAELIDFTIERQRHRRFGGRADVLAQLDEWLLGPGTPPPTLAVMLDLVAGEAGGEPSRASLDRPRRWWDAP